MFYISGLTYLCSKGLTGGLGLSGAAAVAAASELPLSPHGDMPPHPDELSEGDQGTRPKTLSLQKCLACWTTQFFC